MHHVERPTGVGFEERMYQPVAAVDGLLDGTWFYDAQLQNLFVRVRVKAGEDNVIHLSW